jgi:hypothetical protein
MMPGGAIGAEMVESQMASAAKVAQHAGRCSDEALVIPGASHLIDGDRSAGGG